ncbi:hypothetical protein Syun_016303 [Stephania yunnanensis]|uniref:MORN repeat-containing protein 4 n=1 Tax=Stephania yunnanensis TaxID=152371 RepID=A0AAP0J4M4_9MAGN
MASLLLLMIAAAARGTEEEYLKMIDFGWFDFGRKLSSLFDFGLGFLLSFSHKSAPCGSRPSSSSLPLRSSMQNREGERRRSRGRGRGGPGLAKKMTKTGKRRSIDSNQNRILQPLCMSAPVGLTDTVEPSFSCPGRTISLDIFAYTEKELTNGQASLSSSDIAGFRVEELLLPNGDLYSGSLLGNMPESSGKYIWSDGCIYEGEWRRGMRHGHGKTQWPSDVYEGEFSGGYIHGPDAYRRLL